MAVASIRHWNDSGVGRWKADFPALTAKVGAPLHYLDNAATTQTPLPVIEAVSRCLESGQGPIHRGLYPLAERASIAYEGAREKVAHFIGAPRSDQLIFTRSATESINLVARGWLSPRLRPGDRVWVTRMEHHANFLPWQRVCREKGAELRIIELNGDGTLDLNGAEGLWHARTRMIALCQVSNVLGVENPVRQVCGLAAAAGIPVLVDAAQSVSHMPVNVESLGCDFLAFSAHKMYGPGGIGALFGRPERLGEMEPLLVGGGMVDLVEDDDVVWAPVPARFEAGSPNLAGAVGFGAAVDWLSAIGIEQVQAHVTDLASRAADELTGIAGVRMIPAVGAARSAIVSFDVDGVHPHDVAQVAAELGVALRAGHHCCQPLMRHLGLAATVRAGFGLYNDAGDVAVLVEAVHRARRLLAGSF